MRIAFASEGKTIEDNLSCHFGRCKYLIIVDIDKVNNVNKDIMKINSVSNPAQDHEPGDLPNFIANKIKADITVVGGMGPQAVSWFNKLGVKTVILECNKKISYFLNNLDAILNRTEK